MKRYVVMDKEGPTRFEFWKLEGALAFVLDQPDLFVWDRQEQKVVAQ